MKLLIKNINCKNLSDNLLNVKIPKENEEQLIKLNYKTIDKLVLYTWNINFSLIQYLANYSSNKTRDLKF